MVDYRFGELNDGRYSSVLGRSSERKHVARRCTCDSMSKDEFKKFYRRHLAVPVTGFGMAAVLLAIYLTLMTWLAGQVHLMQYGIDRFGH